MTAQILTGHLRGNSCVFGMQGKRPTMEDEEVLLETDRHIVCAVFDGHGGRLVSQYMKQHLPTRVLDAVSNNKNPKEALKAAFINLDQQLFNKAGSRLMGMGCTAIVAVVDKKNRHIYLCNLGDSRGIVLDSHGKVLLATNDHKPDDPAERARIENAGGFVAKRGVWRVNGRLALSRAFGDFGLKKSPTGQYSPTKGPVSAVPDIYEHSYRESDGCHIILACDGVWDVFENRELASIYMAQVKKDGVCNRLVQDSFDRGSRDNITLLAVHLS